MADTFFFLQIYNPLYKFSKYLRTQINCNGNASSRGFANFLRKLAGKETNKTNETVTK
jgi:predicted ATP-grasp superfamily ATP-dependent carboligase